jgi:hypothetical protein
MAEEYKDKYLDLKFENLEKKLDELLSLYGTKASCIVVDDMKVRLGKVEENHNLCPLHGMVKDVDQLKIDRDTLMEVTEAPRFYKKRPSQFKMMIVGFCILILLNGLAFVPTVYFAKKYFAELKVIQKELNPTQEKK